MDQMMTFQAKFAVILVALLTGISSLADAKGQADQPRPFGYTGGYGPGMMGPGMMRGGMMGASPWWDGNGGSGNHWKRTVDINMAESLVTEYLTRFGYKNMRIEEIMEFEFNLYALIAETDTDKGAFELLVDPFTGAIRPEYGPNMMWNTKYGMMGSWSGAATSNAISAEQAKIIAAEYLSRVRGGGPYELHGDEFYGYFTFDFEKGGQVQGMLSVNAFTGQVWNHSWHGGFLSEKEMTM